MSSNAEIQKKLKAGVAAARRGDRTTARHLLEQVVQVDKDNEMAWLWLASAVTTAAERRSCLERVLQINPDNQRAREALEKLGGARSQTPPSSVEQERIRQRIQEARRGQSADDGSLRQRQTTSPQPPPALEREGGFNIVSVLIFGFTILAVALFAFVVFNIVTTNAPAEPTATAVIAAVNTEVPTSTNTPLPTATSIPIDMLTPVVTLPPTFTPTMTPSPTITPTMTPEPTPVSAFPLIYAASNDAGTNLYAVRVGDASGRIFLSNARDVAFTQDGTRIAFVRDVDYGEITAPEIFVADVNGEDVTNEIQLTQLQEVDTGYPSWSPDGDVIAFSSTGGTESEELWLIDADGDNLRRLTNDPAVDIDPSWSPDGTMLIFATDRVTAGFTQLFKVAIRDGDVEQVTFSNGNNSAPNWSPDGQIVFVSNRFGDDDIFITDSEGLAINLVTIDDQNSVDRSPSLSSDGRWIAFVSDRAGEGFQTFVTTIDGRTIEPVIETDTSDTSITFIPVDVE